MSVLQKIRAWFRRRTEGPTDPSKIEHDRQTAMADTGFRTAPMSPITFRLRTRSTSQGTTRLGAALGEPASALLVAEDDRVLAALEHDLEVASPHRLLRPPALDDVPLLADERDRLTVHDPRRPVEPRLDKRGPRLVYSSRGTSSARDSGIRDQGETSTTVQTEPDPVLARTCFRPSRR